MITDTFLNSCLSILLSKSLKIRRNNTTFRDIIEIIDFYEGKDSINIPIPVKSKVDCVKTICEMFLGGKTVETVLDSISLSEKFIEHRDHLDHISNRDLTETEINEIIKQVRLRKRISGLFKNYDDLNRILGSIKEGSFDNIDDVICDYETEIKRLYSNAMEGSRIAEIESSASIDMADGNYEHVFNMIKSKYSRNNKVPTGFSLFDSELLMGGMDKGRLYVFGGGTGAGKSTILRNLIVKSASVYKMHPEMNKPGLKNIYIYITMENTIDESFLCLYQSIFDKTSVQALYEITRDPKAVHDAVMGELEKCNASIIMHYFPGGSISPVDIMAIIDDAIVKYGKESIRAVFIDYLDLLKTDTKFDMYRIELGYITMSLKAMAVQYNLPVVTATPTKSEVQLVTSCDELDVTKIGESKRKTENADFVCIMGLDRFDTKLIHGKIGKNRSGKSNVGLAFRVNYELSKFVTVTKAIGGGGESSKGLDERMKEEIPKEKDDMFSNLGEYMFGEDK